VVEIKKTKVMNIQTAILYMVMFLFTHKFLFDFSQQGIIILA